MFQGPRSYELCHPVVRKVQPPRIILEKCGNRCGSVERYGIICLFVVHNIDGAGV